MGEEGKGGREIEEMRGEEEGEERSEGEVKTGGEE